MSLNDAEQRCMICRAIGYVIAAVIVGLIAWWLFDLVPAWLAIIAFLGLFALGLWKKTGLVVSIGSLCWIMFGISMISNGIWIV